MMEVTLRDSGLTRQDVLAAQLPQNYQAMVIAMKKCESVDQCLEFHSQAAAIGAYFRMAKDKEPMHIAARLRMRAVRRLGELLNREYAARSTKEAYANGEFINMKTLREERVGDVGFAEVAQKIARVADGTFDAIVEAPRTWPVHEGDIVDKHHTVTDDGRIVHKRTGGELGQQLTAAQLRTERLHKTLTDLRRIENRYDQFTVPLTQLEAVRLFAALRDFDKFVAEVERVANQVVQEV